MSQSKFSTNALHAGHDVKANGGTRAVPIYQKYGPYTSSTIQTTQQICFPCRSSATSIPESTILQMIFWSNVLLPLKGGSHRL